MRILFLTAGFPFPPVSGGVIKSLSILEYLRARHDVTVVCFNRKALTAEQKRWGGGFGKIQTVVINKGRNARTLVSSYFTRLPWGIERSRSDEMRRAVSSATRSGEFDAVFVDHWLVAQYLPPGFTGRRFFHEHNAEYVIWRRYAELEKNPLRLILARLEARRVRRYEAGLLRRFDTIFAVSEPDREALMAIGGRPERIYVLPNLPDPELLERPALAFADTEPVIFYFGTLSWPPNLEGLSYFLRAVFPLSRGSMPEARCVIAGADAPDWLRSLAARADGVEFLGSIDDPEPLYQRSRLLIEATHSGGGTKLKVLNALARGLPVVVSREAIEGIDAIAGQHLLTGNDAPGLADAISRLFTDADLWQQLSDCGRLLIREQYTAETAYRPLDEALNRVTANA